jgi:methyltransferase-like protein
MQLNKNIAISEAGFIFNPSTGDSFTTNPVGLAILRYLRGDRGHEEIIDMIIETFSTDRATAEKDLMDYLMMLKNHDLLISHD